MRARERAPWPIRGIDRILDPISGSFPDLRVSGVKGRAERSTGLRDWGESSFEARIEDACEAIRTHPNLTPVGRISIAIYFHMHAVNRLQMVDLLKRHPEILDIPVEKPLFVVGWYRTGTTFLHNLLAADPASRAPRTWELTSPIPTGDDPAQDAGRRRFRSRSVLSLTKPLFPELAVAHDVPIDGPEECFFLLENDFVSSTAFTTMQAFDYAFDLARQDLRIPYEHLRMQYQILAWQRPQRQWVLKAPVHLWHLDSLMHAFPDARIVFTSRCISKALPSNCSLSTITSSTFARKFDPKALGAFWTRYYRIGMERALEQRPRIPAAQQYDLALDALGKDPVGSVRRVYEHFGMDFASAEEAITAEAAAIAAQPRSGKHEYDPEYFGLDIEQLKRDFGNGIVLDPAARSAS